MAALVDNNLKNDPERKTAEKSRLRAFMVLAVSAVMVMSVVAVFMGSNGGDEVNGALSKSSDNISGITASDPVVPSGTMDAKSVMSTLMQNNVPVKYAYLPNFYGASSGSSSVAPLYTSAPAPMGVTDYGLMSPSGINVPYSYNTSGFDGSAMIEGLEPFYPMGNLPYTVSIQLNTVLDHVTVQGNSDYVFWIHSVALYTPGTGTVQLVNNIWNISSPSFSLNSDSILSGNGSTVPGLFYYDVGPTLNVPSTFTLDLYVNTENVNNNNEVVFGYAISNTESSYLTSGTYDNVVFNSVAEGSSEATDPAVFHVDGFKKTPSGLLYDAELVLGGPGGGSTSAIYYANNQFKLKFQDSGSASYTNVPAAYNYGSNTAETVSGLSVWWTSQKNPIAHLSSGPSLFVKLWGSSQTGSGATNIQGQINPSSAFMFVNIGSSYDGSKAAWAPLPQNGTYKFALPGKLDYSGAIILSDYAPHFFDTAAYAGNETETESGPPGNNTTETTTHFNVTLNVDPSRGIYTPLYAFGNDQVPFLTVGSTVTGNVTGNGTESNPYIIENNQYEKIDPLFTHTNAYMFPEFSGVLLRDTNVSVLMESSPAFGIQYGQFESSYLAFHGLPSQNNLNMVFYGTEGVTLYGSSMVTGWFASFLGAYPMANVIFSNSNDFLVADNDFSSMGSSLLIYNGIGETGDGTVWGNHFMPDDLTKGSYAPEILFGQNPTGISVYSSGNLIYNNYFDISRSAYSPAFDINTGVTATYGNDWNLTSKMPLTYVNTVHGFELYGSVVNVNYQGGNYWYDFDGNIPYNDSYNIAFGGDYYPLILPTYNVTFNNIGLPADMTWTVTLHERSQSTQGASITFKVPNGTFEYSIAKPSIYSVSPSSGMVYVEGEPVAVNLTFTLIVYNVTFQQTGLPSGMQWTVTLNGSNVTSTSANASFQRHNGTYSYSVSGPQTYSVSPSSGTVLVDGADVVKNLSFVYIEYPVSFHITGLPAGMSWTLNFDGTNQTLTSDSTTIMALNGTYSYRVYAPDDYSVTPASGSVLVYGSEVNVNLEFSLNHYNVVFKYDGLDPGTLWEVTFNNQTVNTTTEQIAFLVPNGNYSYTVTEVQGYNSDTTSGNILVDHADVSQIVHYSKKPNYLLTVGIIVAAVAAGAIGGYALFRWYSKGPKQ